MQVAMYCSIVADAIYLNSEQLSVDSTGIVGSEHKFGIQIHKYA